MHDLREGPDELRLRAAFEELRVALFQATEDATPAGLGVAVAARARRRRRPAAVIEYGLILAGLVSLTFTRHRITSDGRHRFDALTMLLSGDGLSHDRYSLVGPLFATPMWWLGKVAGGTQPWLRYYNLALFGLALLALFLLLRGRVDPVLLRRFLLLLVAGSMVPAHVPDFYGETFTAMTVGVGFLVAYAAVSHPAVRALGWVAIILGAANTPGTLPPLGLAAGERSASTRRVRYMLAVVVSAALVLGEAWLRRGDPLDQGYGTERFDFPIVLGVLAIGLCHRHVLPGRHDRHRDRRGVPGPGRHRPDVAASGAGGAGGRAQRRDEVRNVYDAPDDQRIKSAFDEVYAGTSLTVVPPGAAHAMAAGRRRRRSRTVAWAGLATLVVIGGAGTAHALGTGAERAGNQHTAAGAAATTPPAPPKTSPNSPYDLALTGPHDVALLPVGTGQLSGTIPLVVRNTGAAGFDGLWLSVFVVRENGSTADNDTAVTADGRGCTPHADADWRCEVPAPVSVGRTAVVSIGVTIKHMVTVTHATVVAGPVVGHQPVPDNDSLYVKLARSSP